MRSVLAAVLSLCVLLIGGCVDAKGAPKAKAVMAKGHIRAYTADWCGPCQREKPELARLAKQAGVKVVTVDCTDHAPTHIKTLPTYEVYDSLGRLISTQQNVGGLRLAFKLLKWILF